MCEGSSCYLYCASLNDIKVKCSFAQTCYTFCISNGERLYFRTERFLHPVLRLLDSQKDGTCFPCLLAFIELGRIELDKTVTYISEASMTKISTAQLKWFELFVHT